MWANMHGYAIDNWQNWTPIDTFENQTLYRLGIEEISQTREWERCHKDSQYCYVLRAPCVYGESSYYFITLWSKLHLNAKLPLSAKCSISWMNSEESEDFWVDANGIPIEYTIDEVLQRAEGVVDAALEQLQRIKTELGVENDSK